MEKSFWLFGTHLTIIDDEKDTDGRYDLVEGVIPPGIETPLHLHAKYSESIYVLEGEFTVYVDKGTFVLRPGDRIFISMGSPHVVASSGNGPAKAITVASPSGFAELIRTAGLAGGVKGTPPDNPNDMQLFMSLSDKIGDIIVGPPAAGLVRSERFRYVLPFEKIWV